MISAESAGFQRCRSCHGEPQLADRLERFIATVFGRLAAAIPAVSVPRGDILLPRKCDSPAGNAVAPLRAASR